MICEDMNLNLILLYPQDANTEVEIGKCVSLNAEIYSYGQQLEDYYVILLSKVHYQAVELDVFYDPFLKVEN